MRLVFLLFALSISFSYQSVRAEQAGSTILPTDIEPLPGKSTASTRPFTSAMQMRLWQKLPAHVFFASTVETSMRIETNPFQYPQKKVFMKQNLPPGTDFLSLSPQEQFTLSSDLSQIGALDNVHRITPNATLGWSFNPSTQVFVNAFFLRDSLCRNYPLNTNTGAVGIGAQRNFNLGEKWSLQAQHITRELWQSQQVPVLDHLPGLTLQYNPTPNLNLFANALLQVRFAHFVGSYMRELDPFYTWGATYQRGAWTFSATSTFVQNFRKPFSKPLTPQNNYTMVCDFEIDRPLFSDFPGLIVFARAEPVYNWRSQGTPGLAGMDMRIYYGIRLAAAKPALSDTIDLIRKRYLRNEQQPGSTTSSFDPQTTAIRKALLRNEPAAEPDNSMPTTQCLTVHGSLPEQLSPDTIQGAAAGQGAAAAGGSSSDTLEFASTNQNLKL